MEILVYISCNKEVFQKKYDCHQYDNHIFFENGYIVCSKIQKDLHTGVIVGHDTASSSQFISNLPINPNSPFSDLKHHFYGANSNLSCGIWYSSENQTITLTRELFGLVPLYYLLVPNQFIIISTSIVSIVNHSEVKVAHLQKNNHRIYTHFFLDSFNKEIDINETIFSNIKSVIPGHLHKITGFKNENILRFKTLKVKPWDNNQTIDETGEELYYLLKKSVADATMEYSNNISSYLSGGLDSSSISTIYRDVYSNSNINTLYNKSKFKDADESYYSKKVAEKINSTHHEVMAPDNHFDLLKAHTAIYGFPENTGIAPTHITNMMGYARKLGSSLILNGDGGDSVIGSGMEVIQQAIQQGNWKLINALLTKRIPYFAFAKDHKAWQNYTHDKKLNYIKQYYFYRFLRKTKSSSPFLEINRYYRFSQKGDLPLSFFLESLIKGVVGKFNNIIGLKINHSIINREFELSTVRPEMPFNLAKSFSSDLVESHNDKLYDILNPSAMFANERMFALGTHYQVLSKSPMQNKELLEYNLSIPDIYKFGRGIGRDHLRNAMKDLLPNEVLNRADKTNLANAYGQDITEKLWNQSKEMVLETTEIWEFIDKNSFLEEIKLLNNDKVPNLQKGPTWGNITKTIMFTVWLNWYNQLLKTKSF